GEVRPARLAHGHHGAERDRVADADEGLELESVGQVPLDGHARGGDRLDRLEGEHGEFGSRDAGESGTHRLAPAGTTIIARSRTLGPAEKADAPEAPADEVLGGERRSSAAVDVNPEPFGIP